MRERGITGVTRRRRRSLTRPAKKEDAVHGLVQDIVTEYGRLDVLVTSAGARRRALLFVLVGASR
jgi:gluconate 5-dehydrogenase